MVLILVLLLGHFAIFEPCSTANCIGGGAQTMCWVFVHTYFVHGDDSLTRGDDMTGWPILSRCFGVEIVLKFKKKNKSRWVSKNV